MVSIWVTLGSLLGASGVILGAFGSHGLEGVLSPEQLDSYQVAVRYQLIHAVLVVLLGLMGNLHEIPTWIPATFVLGVILFSGSIYLLVVGPGWTFLGPVTPVGGLLLIVGWIELLGWSVWIEYIS